MLAYDTEIHVPRYPRVAEDMPTRALQSCCPAVHGPVQLRSAASLHPREGVEYAQLTDVVREARGISGSSETLPKRGISFQCLVDGHQMRAASGAEDVDHDGVPDGVETRSFAGDQFGGDGGADASDGAQLGVEDPRGPGGIETAWFVGEVAIGSHRGEVGGKLVAAVEEECSSGGGAGIDRKETDGHEVIGSEDVGVRLPRAGGVPAVEDGAGIGGARVWVAEVGAQHRCGRLRVVDSERRRDNDRHDPNPAT